MTAMVLSRDGQPGPQARAPEALTVRQLTMNDTPWSVGSQTS